MVDSRTWDNALYEEVMDDLKKKIIAVEKLRGGDSRKTCMCFQCCKLAVREANDALDWLGDDIDAPYVRYVYDGNSVKYTTGEVYLDESYFNDDDRWDEQFGRMVP